MPLAHWNDTSCIDHGKKRKRARTHEDWIKVYGPISKGQMLCHHCDNIRCKNQEHLFLSDCSGNMQDCSNKGRISRGENRPLHVLTEELVRQIRNSPESAGRWALHLSCTKRTILMARNGVTWKHVID